jgi:hypothetical protein
MTLFYNVFIFLLLTMPFLLLSVMMMFPFTLYNVAKLLYNMTCCDSYTVTGSWDRVSLYALWTRLSSRTRLIAIAVLSDHLLMVA